MRNSHYLSQFTTYRSGQPFSGADPYSGISRYQADWGQGTIMDYGPLQRPGTNRQYMAGRADLWSYNYTGLNGLGHIYPQSGYNWADGIFMSDWNGFTGSETYRQGLKKGLTDLGGKLYGFDKLGRIDSTMEYDGFGGRLWRWNPHGGEANVTLGRWLAAGGDFKLVKEAIKKGKGYTLTLGAWELMGEYDLWGDGGEWPTWTHNEIIRMAFENLLSPHEIKVIQNASLVADGPEYQTPEMAYRHGMRAPGQSIKEAQALAYDFIKQQRSKFIQLTGDEALTELAFTMHTLMDMTSPTHKGWQVWDGTDSFENKIKALNHVMGEMFYDIGIVIAAELIRSFYLESVRIKKSKN